VVRNEQGVRLITVGSQGKQSQMVTFLEETKLGGMTNVDNLADEQGDVWKRFGVAYRGTWIFVNQEGKVTKHIGHFSTKTEIQEALEQLKSA